jgi:hypothetical protein
MVAVSWIWTSLSVNFKYWNNINEIEMIQLCFVCDIELFIPIFRYIPILMTQAKIYWDLENYPQVEKV